MDAAELEWIAWTTPITTSLGAALAGRRVYLLNRGSLVNLAAGLGIGASAPRSFPPERHPS